MSNKHHVARLNTFKNIKLSIEDNIVYYNEDAIVSLGDSLELIKKIPSQSISLILTDPPYHTTKKSNIFGDTSFKTDIDYLDWMEQFIIEWKRILKPNGSIFCFCSPKMSSKLDILFQKEFNVLSNIVWTKPNEPGFDGWKQKANKSSLRQWYSHSERIIFAEPYNSDSGKSEFCTFLRETRKLAGLSCNVLTEVIGAYGKVNHGGAVSNWETGRNIPSREQYDKIRDVFLASGKVVDLPLYEDIIRPFFATNEMEFTDVWTFPSVRPYKGKHPAEKPIEMLEQAILATTFEQDIVLDCFSGSGNTALAAMNQNRKVLAIDIEAKWAHSLVNKIKPSQEIEQPQNLFQNNFSHNLLDDASFSMRPHFDDTLENLITC